MNQLIHFQSSIQSHFFYYFTLLLTNQCFYHVLHSIILSFELTKPKHIVQIQQTSILLKIIKQYKYTRTNIIVLVDICVFILLMLFKNIRDSFSDVKILHFNYEKLGYFFNVMFVTFLFNKTNKCLKKCNLTIYQKYQLFTLILHIFCSLNAISQFIITEISFTQFLQSNQGTGGNIFFLNIFIDFRSLMQILQNLLFFFATINLNGSTISFIINLIYIYQFVIVIYIHIFHFQNQCEMMFFEERITHHPISLLEKNKFLKQEMLIKHKILLYVNRLVKLSIQINQELRKLELTRKDIKTGQYKYFGGNLLQISIQLIYQHQLSLQTTNVFKHWDSFFTRIPFQFEITYLIKVIDSLMQQLIQQLISITFLILYFQFHLSLLILNQLPFWLKKCIFNKSQMLLCFIFNSDYN